MVNDAGASFSQASFIRIGRGRSDWWPISASSFFFFSPPHNKHYLSFRGGRSDSCPPRSPPEPCRWTWRSQPEQRRQRRWRWAQCNPWRCKRPSPWSRDRPGTAPRPVRSTAGPCLNPSQQGTASDLGSGTDLQEGKQTEDTVTQV